MQKAYFRTSRLVYERLVEFDGGMQCISATMVSDCVGPVSERIRGFGFAILDFWKCRLLGEGRDSDQSG